MPVVGDIAALPVSREDIERLWKNVVSLFGIPDDEVEVRLISASEIQNINKQYREKDSPTNVLTFTYPADKNFAAEHARHEVLLCETIAHKEAEEHQVEFGDYVAWLLTHAFIHAAGIDHEKSPAEEEKMKDAEKKILKKSGFTRPDIY